MKTITETIAMTIFKFPSRKQRKIYMSDLWHLTKMSQVALLTTILTHEN